MNRRLRIAVDHLPVKALYTVRDAVWATCHPQRCMGLGSASDGRALCLCQVLLDQPPTGLQLGYNDPVRPNRHLPFPVTESPLMANSYRPHGGVGTTGVAAVTASLASALRCCSRQRLTTNKFGRCEGLPTWLALEV